MIEVKVSGATPIETAEQIKAFAALIVLPGIEQAKKLEVEPRVSKLAKKEKVVKEVTPEPEEVEEIEDDEIEGLETESEITLDEIKAKAVELKNSQGAGAVKRLLQKFEIERVTALEKVDYVKFHAALVGALDE